MSDDKEKRGQQDRSRINLEEDYERQYWREKFGVTDEQLRAAVKLAGNNVQDVEQILKKN